MYMLSQKEQIQDVDKSDARGQVTLIAETLRLLANVAAYQGDDVIAHMLYEESLGFTRELDYKWYITSSLEGLATIAAAQGRPARAARLWLIAASIRDTVAPPFSTIDECKLPAPVTRSMSSRERTRLAGGRTQSGNLDLVARRPRPKLVALPVGSTATPGAKSSPHYPDELTAREVEVLRLVAQGLTDAQVAEKLVISPRTVNWHLTSIYGKFQVSSRCAATRYAIEHNLV